MSELDAAVTEVQNPKPEFGVMVRPRSLRAYQFTRDVMSDLAVDWIEGGSAVRDWVPDWVLMWLEEISGSGKEITVGGLSLEVGKKIKIGVGDWIIKDEFCKHHFITDENFKRNFDSA